MFFVFKYHFRYPGSLTSVEDQTSSLQLQPGSLEPTMSSLKNFARQAHRYRKSQNRLLKVFCVPATSAGLPRVSFFFSFLFLLQWPFTVLIKQTRQPVRATKQSIYSQMSMGKQLNSMFVKRQVSSQIPKEIDCLSFVMCPLLAPHHPRAFSALFFAEATNSTNQTNKAGGTCH